MGIDDRICVLEGEGIYGGDGIETGTCPIVISISGWEGKLGGGEEELEEEIAGRIVLIGDCFWMTIWGD